MNVPAIPVQTRNVGTDLQTGEVLTRFVVAMSCCARVGTGGCRDLPRSLGCRGSVEINLARQRPRPDQPGGGIWTRALAGEVDLNTTSTSQGTWQVPAAPGANTSTTTHCNNETRQNFAGLQVGTDISRLNWYGWNVHLGATAGNLGEKSTDNNEFYNGFDVPFLGAYLVATKGRFFADIMVREEFYNGSLL